MENRTYLCIDLKSFYASVECSERGLDPLTANLVVADPERGRGAICLAVSPSMKELGVPKRCRIFQIPDSIEYITAPPRMQLYIEYSANIYGIYLKYLSKDDIYVYSIDEAFLDVTDYLPLYNMTARELGNRIMKDMRDTLGVAAACGIGTNLYLSKVALDITAKHSKDFIGYLNEELFKKTLWNHKPITDFWRIGPGTARRLNTIGVQTMGGVAETNVKLLYQLFGVDAEYLIDHSHGREPTTIAEIKAYKTKDNSLSNGQILMRDYNYEEGLLIVKEMVDNLCLDLVDKGLVTNSIHLYIGYSVDTLPSAKGGSTMSVTTNSVKVITKYYTELYEKLVNRQAPIKRVYIAFQHVVDSVYEQYDLFTDEKELEKDRKVQLAVLDIKKRFGKNAIIKAMDLQEAATARERNRMIGGHKSGE
jgi:DNA polymerase V